MLAQLTALALTATTVVPDARYGANWLYRFFFGSQWRDAWTVPIDAPVLDLDTFDGGLRPERRGGGLQTVNVHFKSANGRTWAFRSMDKDSTRVLDPETRESVIGDIFQDLTSTAHPCSALMVAPLMDAVGIPHPTPQLVVLPEDPRLLPFGKLGGMLGFIEDRSELDLPGVDRLVETAGLFERLERRSDEQVDATAYLRARLIDILVGDWDRHVDQWRWVRYKEEGRSWRPVPRDRDQAFSRFDAIVPAIGQYYTKQLASFREHYPSIEKLTFSGRFTDRRYLVPLEKAEWDAVTAEVKAKITDAVISEAVHRLPPAMLRQGGDELERALRARRDHLDEASRDFYRLLADRVDIRDPEDAGPIEVKKVPAGVEVAIRRGDVTVFRRTFLPDETSEIRLYAPSGEGRPRIDPAADDAIPVRIASSPKSGAETVRDWGYDLLFFPFLSYDGTRGLVPGARALLTRYGFELDPFSSQMNFSAAFATTVLRPRLEYSADLRTHSPLRGLFYVGWSGMDGGRFYGIGNETTKVPPPTAANPTQGYFDLRQERFFANGLAEIPLLGPLRGRAGLVLESVHTRSENVIADLNPYGAGWMTFPAGELGLALDTRSGVLAAQRGFRFLASVRYAPPWIDNQHGFTKLRGEASTNLGMHLLTDLLLGLRVSGEKNWGTYPFFDAAYAGGTAYRSGLDLFAPFGGNMLRGFDLNRFAGDAAVVGNAELRIVLGKANAFLPLRYGVVGLGDVGRVFVAGESSSVWHNGVGGGLWLALLATAPGAAVSTSFNLLFVRSDESTSIYLAGGFGF